MIITSITQLVNYLENNIDKLEQIGELIDGDVCLFTTPKTDISVDYYMVQIPVELWKEYENNHRLYPFVSMSCEFDIIGWSSIPGGEEDHTALSWIC